MSQNHPVADPCINICRMDQSGKFCQGCKRTALEIAREQEEAARREAAAKRELEFQDAVLKYGPKE